MPEKKIVTRRKVKNVPQAGSVVTSVAMMLTVPLMPNAL